MPTLNWIGKEACINHHDEVPIHTLTHDPDRSLGAENEPLGTGNLLVEGDNLLALKALLPYYAGRVKCIYIDPPYNTGNESWIYNDNVNNPIIQKWLGKTVGKLAEDLSRHDKWLCMMYPRLCLLHQLLREDGVIFISIDDNEVHHLRMLMDEIFGEKNFFAILTRRAMHTVRNSSKDFNHNAEYTFILDSFAGSGTTGHAVLEQNQEDGGNRQFILVELESKIAREVTSVRLERVSEGYTYEQKGRLQHAFGTGGTFSYYHVGETFLEKEEIAFSEMAQLLFFKETGTPRAVDIVVSLMEGDRPSYGACPANERYKRAFLGSADGVGVYLLNSDDILTEDLIKRLPRHDGMKIIHCGGTQLTEATLKQLGITFRQMPYNLV